MLAGFRRQQVSRRLRSLIIDGRERVLRRFQAATGGWPWTPTQLEGWIAAGGWAHSTVRSYQGAVALFCDYACDPRYGWVAECKQRIDVAPSRICHDENMARHVADHEGRPEWRAAVEDPDHRPSRQVPRRPSLSARGGRCYAVTLAHPSPQATRLRDAYRHRADTGALSLSKEGAEPAVRGRSSARCRRRRTREPARTIGTLDARLVPAMWATGMPANSRGRPARGSA
jgi:hypothetical protein